MSRSAIITFVLILFHLFAAAQNLDSLMALLQIKTGAERADILFELGNSYLFIDLEKAKQYSYEGYELSAELKDTTRIIRTARVFASALRRIGESDSAIQMYQMILPWSKKDEKSEEYYYILNGLAIAYTDMAKYDKALYFNLESMEKRQLSRDSAGVTITLNNIGLVYYKLKDYKKAIVYYLRCIALKRRINFHHDLHMALVNLGLCYVKLDDVILGRKYIQEGLVICGKDCPYYVKVNATFGMGLIHMISKDYPVAEKYFLESYALAEENADDRFQFDAIDNLMEIYLIQNKTAESFFYLKKAEQLIQEGTIYNLERMKMYSRFFKLYISIKNFERATFYQQKYIQLKDSAFNEEFTNSLMKVEADFVEQQNKEKITAQLEVLKLKEEVIERQRVLNIITSFLVFILITFAVVIWRNYSQKKTANVLLDKKVKERTVALELSRDELKRAFEERDLLIERASIDIKNTLLTMQGLCALGLKDISDPTARQYIYEMDKTSSHLYDNLRSLSHVKESL